MRKGTREAIYYAVEHLTPDVRTSGAVSFDWRDVAGGGRRVCVYSYNMCIAELFVHSGATAPTHIVIYTERRSVTTSKHQGWTHGAINRYWPDVLLIEGSDEMSNAVAYDKAMDKGWGGIDAATLERVKNYGEDASQ